MNQSTAEATHVVVLGAGYAGVMATNRFLGSLDAAQRRHVTVTVVNPRDDFVERIRLHQLAAGSISSVSRPLMTVLHPDATVLRGRAQLIHPEEQTVDVLTDQGTLTLAFDHLVYAVGSCAAAPIEGARRHAFLLADLDGAEHAAVAITEARGADRLRILIVGGGFTGVEAASEIAERHPTAEVTLVSADRLVPTMRSAAQATIRRTLRNLGVRVIEGAEVVEIGDRYAITVSGEKLEFDVCLVAASFEVPDLAKASGLEVDPAGRLLVHETLHSHSHPAVLGAGDAVAVTGVAGEHLRMACSVAVPMGGHAASVLLCSITGGTPHPFDMGFTAQCLSLGRRRGYFQPVQSNDNALPIHVGGRIGARIKEAICRRVIDAPTEESTRPGTYTWRHTASR